MLYLYSMGSRDRDIKVGECYTTFGRHFYLVRPEDTLHINNSDGALLNTLGRDFLKYCGHNPRRISKKRFDIELEQALIILRPYEKT